MVPHSQHVLGLTDEVRRSPASSGVPCNPIASICEEFYGTSQARDTDTGNAADRGLLLTWLRPIDRKRWGCSILRSRGLGMSNLTDEQLDRLSILFATGKMSNARKIVRLLGNERENEPYPTNSDNALPRMLDRFLRAGAAENWA
jgi:hypothetical protein